MYVFRYLTFAELIATPPKCVAASVTPDGPLEEAIGADLTPTIDLQPAAVARLLPYLTAASMLFSQVHYQRHLNSLSTPNCQEPHTGCPASHMHQVGVVLKHSRVAQDLRTLKAGVHRSVILCPFPACTVLSLQTYPKILTSTISPQKPLAQPSLLSLDIPP